MKLQNTAYGYALLLISITVADTELESSRCECYRSDRRRLTNESSALGYLRTHLLIDNRSEEISEYQTVKNSFDNVTRCGQVLTASSCIGSRVSQFDVTERDAVEIRASRTAGRRITTKSRGQLMSLRKHPSVSLTKNQRGENKQPEMNTGGQIHTNLLKESRDMSTPLQTANRTGLLDDKVSQDALICEISWRDFVDDGLLSERHTMPDKMGISYNKSNGLTHKFPSVLKNMINDALEIPVRSAQQKRNDKPKPLIKGIYFSEVAEGLCKAAMLEAKDTDFVGHVPLKEVFKMEIGHCGKGQNRLVVFEDGSKACVKYRSNIDQIQGEIYSYYLGKLLKLNNVPRPVISVISADSRRWSRVRDKVLAAQWAPQAPFVFTQWIENITETYIPTEILGFDNKLFPGMFDTANKTVAELCGLLQWSDLIIFDFLTGHLDRVVNMLYNSKWSPGIFSKPIHNLLISKKSGKLVYMDNESGLIHGYRQLDKFDKYHWYLLTSVCLFRRDTVDSIANLHRNGDIDQKLKDMFSRQDENFRLIPNLPSYVIRTLQHRIGLVYKHIQNCATSRII